MGFQVWIDGIEIKPDVEVRALVKGGDITAELKRLGVDLVKPSLDRPGVDPGVVDALRRLDATTKDEFNAFAIWTTKVTFHWQHTFPMGKGVAVRHRYRPIYGARFSPVDPNDQCMRIKKEDRSLGGQWCSDRSINDAEL